MIQPNDVILFQGDSITDADRKKDNDRPNLPIALGRGYAFFAAALLLERFADHKLAIYNRGISGNRVTNLADRWQRDTLDLKPNVLSILIGVNDTWHGTAKGTPENGVTVERYDQVFRDILTQAQDNLPGLRLVICDPFVLPCGAVNDVWFPEFTERRAVAKAIADDFDAVFVPFQDIFDQAQDRASADTWAADGVHPSVAGHMLMAQTWVQTVCDQ